MVYATVIAENVEALLGFEVISAFLHNSRKAISWWFFCKDLQKLKLYGTCMIGNGILESFAPDDWIANSHMLLLQSLQFHVNTDFACVIHHHNYFLIYSPHDHHSSYISFARRQT